MRSILQIFVEQYQHSLAWFRRNERKLSPLALVFGFVMDNLTLRRPDLWAENLFILSYLTFSLLAIMLLTAYEAGRLAHRGADKVARFLPFLLQFFFGGLASVNLVFYGRGAALGASWPFLLLLFVLLVGNDFLRARYQRLAVRLTVWFVLLLAYAAFAIPLVTRQMGDGIFIISGLSALAVIALVLAGLWKVAAEIIRLHWRWLAVGIGGVFITVNALYFLNFIPPLPLALTHLGIYHSLTRTVGGYALTYEPAPWYTPWRATAMEYHWIPGAPVYAMSAIFAPAEFKFPIYHVWSRYEEASGDWVEMSRLGFPVSGGRDGGYRGYSLKRALTSGEWRVQVVTEQGKSLGRTRFTLVETDMAPELIEAVR